MGKAQRKRALSECLISMRACPEAVEWVGTRNLAAAWHECERADWMLWLCGKMVGKHGWPRHEDIVLAACDCALTAKQWWWRVNDCPARAIETAQKWACGKASIDEVRHVVSVTHEAFVTAPSNVSPSAADHSAYFAASTATYNTTGAEAVKTAADAAADAAFIVAVPADAASCDAYAAAADARRRAHTKMCHLIRKRLTPGRMVAKECVRG